MKLTSRQRAEWARAIFTAAHQGATRMPVVTFFKAARAVWRAMTTRDEEVALPVYYQRMVVCQECPVYVARRKTCGFIDHEGVTLGCGCYLPVLAKLRGTHCWLRENTQLEGVGWPDELMSK
jgi:hypothetical protein